MPQAPFCVGFAAETENVLEFAAQKRLNKKLPLIAANTATSAMGSDDNQITLIDDQGTHPLPRANKLHAARMLLTHIAQML